MGVDEVKNGDSSAQKDAEDASNHDQVEAPAEREGEDGLLHADEQRRRRYQLGVDEV